MPLVRGRSNPLRNSIDRRWAYIGLGALASLGLHALLIGSVVFGTARHERISSNPQGAGTSGVVSSAEPIMTLILITEPSEHSTSAPPEEIPSRGPMPADLPIQIASSDSLPSTENTKIAEPDEKEASLHESAGDPAGRALLFGRYMGQIEARIERAWERPRSPVDDVLFRCQVQILQGPSGDVKEVTIESCNGDAQWQQSLVDAIQSASPLPAPPDPSVFADGLNLSFESEAYRPGGSAQGFEPAKMDEAAHSAPFLGR